MKVLPGSVICSEIKADRTILYMPKVPVIGNWNMVFISTAWVLTHHINNSKGIWLNQRVYLHNNSSKFMTAKRIRIDDFQLIYLEKLIQIDY